MNEIMVALISGGITLLGVPPKLKPPLQPGAGVISNDKGEANE